LPNLKISSKVTSWSVGTIIESYKPRTLEIKTGKWTYWCREHMKLGYGVGNKYNWTKMTG
jgi:hypothetical protein